MGQQARFLYVYATSLPRIFGLPFDFMLTDPRVVVCLTKDIVKCISSPFTLAHQDLKLNFLGTRCALQTPINFIWVHILIVF